MSEKMQNQQVVSGRLVETGVEYLASCSIGHDPSLVRYREFMQYALEFSIEASGEVWPPVTQEMSDRAVSYCYDHFDPATPEAIADPQFVNGLLNYALLGVEVPSLNIVKH